MELFSIRIQRTFQLVSTVLNKEKWLFKHVPLKEIARYIGITPQALSKARKKIFR